MRKLSIIFIFIAFIYFFHVPAKIYIKEENGKKTKVTAPHVFDVCILLEPSTGTELAEQKGAKIGAITATLLSAVTQKEALIVSAPLIKLLVKASYARLAETETVKNQINETINAILSNQWLIYKTKNDQFAILIPKERYKDITKNDRLDLEKIGVNQNILDGPLNIGSKEKLEETFSIEIDKIDLKTLKEIFIDYEKNSKKPKVKKRIILGGHGLPYKQLIPGGDITKKAVIAQLDRYQYMELLDFLKKIDCVFLYIISCHVGGLNQLTMQFQLDNLHQALFTKFKSIAKLPFPIVTGSMTDTEAITTGKEQLNTYFNELHFFLTDETTALEKSLSSILQNITISMANNLPSIKYPGIPFYRAAIKKRGKLENVLYDFKKITYPVIIKHEIELKKENGKIKPKPGEAKPLKITFDEKETAIKTILLYPSIIQIPLEITINEAPTNLDDLIAGVYYPKIASMIGGNAHHYQAKIIAKSTAKTIYTNLVHFIMSIASQHKVYPTMFFIKNLVLENHEALELKNKEKKTLLKINRGDTVTLENVTIQVDNFDIKKPLDSFLFKEVIFKKGNQYYSMNANPTNSENLADQFIIETINPKDAEEKIVQLIKETTPYEEALFEATGGIETEGRFRQSVAKNLQEEKSKEELKKKVKKKKVIELETDEEKIKALGEIKKIDIEAIVKAIKNQDWIQNFLKTARKDTDIFPEIYNIIKQDKEKITKIYKEFEKTKKSHNITRFLFAEISAIEEIMNQFLAILNKYKQTKNAEELKDNARQIYEEIENDFSKLPKIRKSEIPLITEPFKTIETLIKKTSKTTAYISNYLGIKNIDTKATSDAFKTQKKILQMLSQFLKQLKFFDLKEKLFVAIKNDREEIITTAKKLAQFRYSSNIGGFLFEKVNLIREKMEKLNEILREYNQIKKKDDIDAVMEKAKELFYAIKMKKLQKETLKIFNQFPALLLKNKLDAITDLLEIIKENTKRIYIFLKKFKEKLEVSQKTT